MPVKQSFGSYLVSQGIVSNTQLILAGNRCDVFREENPASNVGILGVLVNYMGVSAEKIIDAARHYRNDDFAEKIKRNIYS